MKALALLLTMMIFCIASAAASPAAPIFSGSRGLEGLHTDFFPGDLLMVNWLFQGLPAKTSLPSVIVANGSRFGFSRTASRHEDSGFDNKIVMAGIYTKVAESWGVTVGYESSPSRFGGLNFGAFYHISPNAAVSIVSTLNTNYTLLKNTAITTQLIIRF